MENRDYKVGYGRPPESSRFKAGQSGNLKGRPKRKRGDFLSDFMRELSAKIVLSDGSSITKEKAIVRQLINNAAKGDIRSQKMTFSLLEKGKKRTKGELLLSRLLKDNYLTEEDINGFLYGNKEITANNICGSAYCKINTASMLKRARSFEAAKIALLLQGVKDKIGMMTFLSTICETVACEYRYWQGVRDILAVLEVGAEEKAVIMKGFCSKQAFTPPGEELYANAMRVLFISLISIKYYIAEFVEVLKTLPGYEDAEKAILDDKEDEKMLLLAKEELSARDYEDLVDSLKYWKGLYVSGDYKHLSKVRRSNKKYLSVEYLKPILNWYESSLS